MTDENKYSYATERKIRKIKEVLGDNWANQIAGKSIDSVYNEIVGDTRKNVFYKAPEQVKAHLDEMIKANRVQMDEWHINVIEREYEAFKERQQKIDNALVSEFTGA